MAVACISIIGSRHTVIPDCCDRVHDDQIDTWPVTINVVIVFHLVGRVGSPPPPQNNKTH